MQELPDLLDKVIPSVVQIMTPTGQGTGFVINENGLIITNKHVVGYNKFVQIRNNEEDIRYGQVVAANPYIDLAVVYSEGTFNNKLKLADSSEVRLGESVVAVGHPYGYDYTISQGIISSIGRKDVNPTFKDVGFFQLDMGINPGNSGGPVLKRTNGEVIGMVTMGVLNADNIGFAVPSTYNKQYLDEIAAYDRDTLVKKIYCSICGNLNPHETKYCQKCGAKIETLTLEQFVKSMPKDVQPGKEKKGIEVEGQVKCPSCGAENKKESRYCEKCGTTLG
jgi:serine protease Do